MKEWMVTSNSSTKQAPSPGWGYRLYPHPISKAHAYERVDIAMRPEATRRHFDPEQVYIPVLVDDVGFETGMFYHPWTFGKHYMIGPGRVSLVDRLNKVETLYTFGGKMQVITGDEMTLCVIESAAPILKLCDFSGLNCRLADEADILLAEMRAHNLPDLEDYEHYLMETRPVELYLACLRRIQRKYKDFPIRTGESARDFIEFLGEEIRIFTQNRYNRWLSSEERNHE